MSGITDIYIYIYVQPSLCNFDSRSGFDIIEYVNQNGSMVRTKKKKKKKTHNYKGHIYACTKENDILIYLMDVYVCVGGGEEGG